MSDLPPPHPTAGAKVSRRGLAKSRAVAAFVAVCGLLAVGCGASETGGDNPPPSSVPGQAAAPPGDMSRTDAPDSSGGTDGTGGPGGTDGTGEAAGSDAPEAPAGTGPPGGHGEPDAPAGETDHAAHGGPREIPDGVAPPSVAIEVAADPVEGWNLRLLTTNFDMAPERVSTEHVDGEGHAHLYINGVKVSRIYGQWHHIGALGAGEHEVMVELSSNDHSALAVGGHIIAASAALSVRDDSERQATSEPRPEARPAEKPYPSLVLAVVDDPAGGWNIHAVPSDFRLTAANVSQPHTDGEGYMRLFINGEGTARVYETWYQLPPLPAGVHEVRVELRSNDHAQITVGGEPVAAVATLRVSNSEAQSPPEDDARHGGDGHHH